MENVAEVPSQQYYLKDGLKTEKKDELQHTARGQFQHVALLIWQTKKVGLQSWSWLRWQKKTTIDNYSDGVYAMKSFPEIV